jgi:hypothetical protein
MQDRPEAALGVGFEIHDFVDGVAHGDFIAPVIRP